MERRLKRTLVAGLALLSAMAALLIGASSRAATPVGKLVLALGTAPPDLTCHTFYYAVENGFYKEEGLDLEIKPLVGDQAAVRAIVAGEADVAWTGFAAALQAIEAGAQIVGISSTSPQLDYLLVAQKDVRKLSDLEGRSLGVSTPGAVSHQVPRLMMVAAGADPGRMQVVPIGGSAARVQALIAKKIDAAALNSSFAIRTAKVDYLHVIGDAARDLPSYVYAWEIVLRRLLTERRSALQAFVTGTVRGARWAAENPERATAISQRVLPDVPKDEIAAGVAQFAKVRYWNVNGTLPESAWSFTVSELLKGGEIKRSLVYGEHVTTDFTREAVGRLGPAK
jgi:ABC-type nitrate/sulfonate/bicarbonate transport system substrate-binding protein